MRCPTATVTPGVNRPAEDPDRDILCSEPATYRSAVGSLLHLAQDLEVIAYATKELSKEMHQPSLCAWHGLTRVCRYLSDKIDYVVEKNCTEINPIKHVLTMQCDSD